MSTPTFAPGLSSYLPTHLTHHPPLAPSPTKARPPPPSSATSHVVSSPSARSASSASSSSSSISSRSPASSASALTNSSVFSHGGSMTFSQASSASAATSASPGSFDARSIKEGVAMEDDQPPSSVEGSEAEERGRSTARRRAGSEGDESGGSGERELAELSVQENDGIEGADTSPQHSAAAGSGKTRRASTLSTGSQREGSWTAGFSSEAAAAAGTGGKGQREGQPARRKAARVGSFRREAEGGEDGMAVEGDDESEGRSGQQDSASSQHPHTAPGQAAPSSGTTRPPIVHSSTSSFHQTDPTPTPPPPPAPQPTRPHVDLVSYPSADLLRLLASLLEQIAHTNDTLRQRQRTASASRVNSGANSPTTPAASTAEDSNDDAFQKGRFDAAPLNSPASPRYRPTPSSAAGETPAEEEDDPMDLLPVTPGVDLLREVGEGGGVEGFMPSLGGSHSPMPLARRRGSSFLTSRREDGSAVVPSVSRRGSTAPKSSNSGTTQSLGQVAATAVASSSSGATSDSSAPSASAAPPAAASSSSSEPPLTSLLTASSDALSSPSATLCFHARNVPAISIEAYLLRILKYCPTTNEVFLSLLVYFDRMARVGLEAQRVGIAPKAGEVKPGKQGKQGEDEGTSKLFAIDSFNVHRLVIAGVTVASKFFSDVFYTNSRYAKVGGLPLHELNQLELQFLLLNDFRLVIPVSELQNYADQLILFWVGRNPSTGVSTHPHPATATTPAPAQTPTVTAPTIPATVAVASQTPASFFPPTTPSTSTSSASYTPRASSADSRSRPRSIRSQPSTSSSGTSVTSTVTPGTPRGEGGDSSDEEWGRQHATGSRRGSDAMEMEREWEGGERVQGEGEREGERMEQD